MRLAVGLPPSKTQVALMSPGVNQLTQRMSGPGASCTITTGKAPLQAKACHPSRSDLPPASTPQAQRRAPHRRAPASPSAAQESSEDSRPPQKTPSSGKGGLPAGSAALVLTVLITGVFNRVFYKMALQPLGNYVFFLAQFQTFSYVFVYFAVLLARRRAGQISPEMIAAPAKWRFGVIGVCEALAQVLGFLSASHLPGVILPLLSQTIMFWQIALNKIVRNKSLKRIELAGATTVVAGVVLAAWPTQSGGSVLTQVHPIYTAVYLISVFFPAIATIFKETIFDEAKQKLGKPLDIFVVNSFSSASQAGWVFLMLPLLSALRGIPPRQLPDYLIQGWACLRGLQPSCGSNCSAAPQLAALYVATNLAFNISLLTLLRSAGNIALSLTLASLIPLTIWAFTFPFPYLEAAPPLGPNFMLGVGVLLAGLLTYNSPNWLPALRKRGAPMLTAPE